MSNKIYSINELNHEMKEKFVQTPIFTKIIFCISSVIFLLHLIINFSNFLYNSLEMTFFSFNSTICNFSMENINIPV